jgi:ubiquinone/menaquinone biosynthesis C-methylase UbiE
LPFPDQTFKYVVSADFFGHVPITEKEMIISEMTRVLVPGGIMAHVIETDSVNLFFRFAHRYPDLFRKYFIEQIGGHYGLEMPTAVVQRFNKHGLKILQVEKMFGPIWDTRLYIAQFNNEYLRYSRLLRGWIAMCRLLSSNPLTMVIADALLGIASNAVDRFKPLDNTQGIFLVAKKIG